MPYNAQYLFMITLMVQDLRHIPEQSGEDMPVQGSLQRSKLVQNIERVQLANERVQLAYHLDNIEYSS